MPRFKLVTEIKPKGDQPLAIEALGDDYAALWVEGRAEPLRFGEALRCEACGIDYADPTA